uniref:Dystonin n=1 Tax=Sphenodon punctatus TaxID=8508 RepID=A0A8D0GLL1_SPHPU
LKSELECQPSHVYLDTLKKVKNVLNESESKVQSILNAVNDPGKAKRALQQTKTVCETLEKQKITIDNLAADTKALEKHASADVANIYKQELKHVEGQWDKLKVSVSKDVHLLEEILSKLRIFETDSKIIQKWIDGVKDFLMKEKATQGDSEGLQRQLDQCM